MNAVYAFSEHLMLSLYFLFNLLMFRWNVGMEESVLMLFIYFVIDKKSVQLSYGKA